MKLELPNLQQPCQDGSRVHLTFEISGEAGYRYDALRPYVDTLTVTPLNN
jgi:hypothetical protein